LSACTQKITLVIHVSFDLYTFKSNKKRSSLDEDVISLGEWCVVIWQLTQSLLFLVSSTSIYSDLFIKMFLIFQTYFHTYH